ncbi:MAG: DUF2079 domain-containing protein [Prolixibacteraceae bacterium]|nr:DUF2079 domain-containing protein [Prolixibacteraceae bacterium]
MRITKKQIPYIILIIFGILIFFMGILNHYLFKTVTHDYGNYNFAFWDYAHFRLSDIPTSRGNFLQDHFSFTLMYFIPVYWLLSWLTGTYTLIIIQCSLIIIAAWYSFKIINLKSNDIWLVSGVLIYYFTLLGRYTAFSGDVNLAVMSSCFIPVFIYYFQIKKYFTAFVILILSLFSRENIPLWFIFIFIVLIIEHRRDKKAIIFGLSGIAISMVYFIMLFKIFIPSVESEVTGYTLFNYSALGESPWEAMQFVIQNPVESIKLFFINHLDEPANDWIKIEFYLVCLISGGFVLLLRPQYLIWFIPIVAQKVLNDSSIRWGIATYYTIEVVTLLPLSVFMVISQFKTLKLKKSLVLIVCLATISVTINKMDKQNNQVPWTLNPSKVNIFHKSFYEAPFNVKKVNKLLKQIPPNAKVSASNIILPHLAQRQHIYFFPDVKDAEYIVFSVYDNNYIFSNQYNEDNRNQVFSDTTWMVIAQEFPVFLFKRISNQDFQSGIKPWQTMMADTIFCNYENLDTINNLVLSANREIAEKISLISDKMSFSEMHSIKLTSENPFSSVFQIDKIHHPTRVNISVWCYGREENRANIIADCGDDYKFHSSQADTIMQSGWKRLVLSFWMPQNSSECTFSLWNNGTQPVYFDDLQVITNYPE